MSSTARVLNRSRTGVPSAGVSGPATARSRTRRPTLPTDPAEASDTRKDVKPRLALGPRSKTLTDNSRGDKPKLAARNTNVTRRNFKDESDPKQDANKAHLDLAFTDEGQDLAGSDESITSVEYSMNAAEVVVQGENVTKVSVKFPPHPPDDGSRLGSAQRRLSRPASRIESQSQMKNEHLPYPTEESSEKTDNPKQVVHYDFPQLLGSPETDGVCSGSNTVKAPLTASQDSAFHSSSMSLSGLDMDSKFKQDMLHSIEYFDRRNNDLKHVNAKMAKENERLREANKHLEDYINQLDKRYDSLNDDHNEMKVKLDQLEKENAILKDESVEHWQAKVKAEEMYIELKRDSTAEIKTLTESLERKNSELINRSEAQRRRSSVVSTSSKEELSEKLELVHKIAHLEDEMKKLKNEKDNDLKLKEEVKEELNDLQCLYRQKTAELDAQYKRFLSLKKSFNELMEENETIKKQFRERKEAINSTWPINKSTSLVGKRHETVALIDLVAQNKSKTSAFPKVDTRGKLTGARARTDNLPPV